MQGTVFKKLLGLAALLQSASAAPVDGRGGQLEVVKTTTSSDGQVIDWVVPESQGKIASPPPAPPRQSRSDGQLRVEDLIPADPAMRGPKGTVPILRSGGPTFPEKRLPGPGDNGDNGDNTTANADASYAGQHWYASSGQPVANHGGQATFSLYKAYVQSGGDFSLLQTAVIRDNAPHAGMGPVSQTVEAGWINYPNQIRPPHLFSYFTTNGYSADGDNIGGWNRDHAGWVQTDGDIYPGIAFAPLSTGGGTQYELEIGFLLFEDNWWLWVLDRYVGYYPGALFAAGVNPGDTLAGGSTMIDFYGEIFNSEQTMMTTDMGSGEFPEKGFGRAAYMHNIVYVDNDGHEHDYDGGGQIIVSDPARYRIQPSFRSGRRWGSFMFLGGPGAGGVVGG